MKNPHDEKQTAKILLLLLLFPVIWAALLAAPFLSEGLSGIIRGFTNGMNHPFAIQWCEDSLKTMLIFLACYGLGVGIYYATRKNYRKGEEHGSAQWGSPKQVLKKYAEQDFSKNIILTQNTRMGLDGRKHRRNLNILVVGGSGAGKTRFYAKPNVMQANTSFVVLDPNGNLQ